MVNDRHLSVIHWSDPPLFSIILLGKAMVFSTTYNANTAIEEEVQEHHGHRDHVGIRHIHNCNADTGHKALMPCVIVTVVEKDLYKLDNNHVIVVQVVR